MERVKYAIVGAGISGLALANFLDGEDYAIFERDAAIGGYCKTVVQDGFVWDYSGHFFHFRYPEIEALLRSRMEGQEILTVEKQAKILYKGALIDFPFQKNIHQLPKDEFIDCLYDLWFRPETAPPFESFAAMLEARFGKGITARFLTPYNEKLYACALDALDADAMGRFFPYAEVDDIIRNFRQADNASYNATFTYPRGGAIQYVNALYAGVEPTKVHLGEGVVRIERAARVLETSAGRRVRYEVLVSSAPFDRLMGMVGEPVSPSVFSSNRVHVFNFGFDRKGPDGMHWLYVPERQFVFYRVGFYDNIFGDARMSLYVEVGQRTDETVDPAETRSRVLADLEAAGIVDGHQLVSEHQIVLDPAYVHIRSSARQELARLREGLEASGVFTIGRYGGWTYCSIEDNIVEARALAERLNGRGPLA